MTRLVFAGEALVDLLMRIPALPERGGDMLAESSSVQVGGGFNIMAAAARQGLPVVYAGGHGTGPWGDRVRSALAAEGIMVLRPPDPDADTGFDVALVEADGERTAGQLVPVRLEAHVTEVGTLELWCVARDGKGRWKLEYSVRERD